MRKKSQYEISSTSTAIWRVRNEFRIRGHEPHSQLCYLIGSHGRIRFLAEAFPQNKILLFQQRISRFHAISFYVSSIFFCGWHTLHIGGWQAYTPRPVTKRLRIFLATTKQNTYFESCSHWQLLNVGNWIKDCRRDWPSFVVQAKQ